MPEVAIIRDERGIIVDTRLGDEAVGEFGLAAAMEELRAKIAGALPVTGKEGEDLEDRIAEEMKISKASVSRMAKKAEVSGKIVIKSRRYFLEEGAKIDPTKK